MIDLIFPVLGQTLPSDHSYALYGALAGPLPHLHENGEGLAIGAISGQYIGNGKLQLGRYSSLRLRLPVEQIAAVIALAGKQLEVAGNLIRIGVPRVQALVPAPALSARLVTIKGFTEPETFLEAVRRQLSELSVNGEPGIPLTTHGPHADQPRRRILRIKDKKVVGFPLHVTGLTAEDSVKLQTQGAGGRRKMGCGLFVPLRDRS